MSIGLCPSLLRIEGSTPFSNKTFTTTDLFRLAATLNAVILNEKNNKTPKVEEQDKTIVKKCTTMGIIGLSTQNNSENVQQWIS